jgi:hypothetical protein
MASFIRIHGCLAEAGHLTASIFGGTTEIHKEIIARSLDASAHEGSGLLCLVDEHPEVAVAAYRQPERPDFKKMTGGAGVIQSPALGGRGARP